MIDYAAIANNVTSMIGSAGVPITVSRAGVTLLRTNAVFTNTKAVEIQGDPTSRVSRLNLTQTDAYIPATKTPPQPGDVVVGKGRQFRIVTVEAYQPALTVLAYKLSMS